MQNEYEVRLFELLAQAVSWSETACSEAELRERADELCRDGPVPATALLEALDQCGRLDHFLEDPAWEDSRSEAALAAAGLTPWQAGQTVGRFRLLELLGQGGMGQVFLAEQDEPYRRVALKLIRSDGLSRAVVRRFGEEQEALARLNHPHIAQLYEADITESGEPFLAMEWVDGCPIDLYLAENELGLLRRLRLFQDICSALRHAHQKQIVHRDLKPSNLLVQEIDGEPMGQGDRLRHRRGPRPIGRLEEGDPLTAESRRADLGPQKRRHLHLPAGRRLRRRRCLSLCGERRFGK